ncbi:ferredoxin [Yoonia sediminilitoris]|uniref:4Fe-4S ferredoxin-type domain-containing protein n=1 Tax=Yoonia sediminilitoris TaxID=1286148 RepID=A0A2T6KFR7_9RHOB|nr:ferredoxin [Yoonia sediminilitoris]PUB14179.1 hypothetical protein C8N45_10653 [Yoonia sediminilitoris]RCW95110.1 hypothetical protein DFP92_10653 [Yoonia sediminilitoris]
MKKTTTELDDSLGDIGLRNLGSFAVTPTDGLPAETGSLLLIGPDEPNFWVSFCQSSEYAGGGPDALDRWSRRHLDRIASEYQGHALYPFGGPPYQPFHTWALRTGQFWASPIGFLVHAQVGLFVSFRGALLVQAEMPAARGTKPCDSCSDMPCLSACPVDAFADGYDVAACKSHLRVPENSCMTAGCLARHACPVGKGRRLPEQAAFHMKAFL